MSWVKWDDSTGEHRKNRRLIRSAGLGGFGMHALGVFHSARYLLDGQLEHEFVNETFELARTSSRDKERIVAGLEEQGIWLPSDSGWTIHDYLDHNPSRAQVLERRRKEAERKARGRVAQSNGSPHGVR